MPVPNACEKPYRPGKVIFFFFQRGNVKALSQQKCDTTLLSILVV